MEVADIYIYIYKTAVAGIGDKVVVAQRGEEELQ